MIFLCSPHNPTGRVWSKEELTKLATICEKYDLLIVTDEIHSDLIFNGYKHTPIASISEAISKRTITTIAPSKTFNVAGLSSSIVIISNPKLREQYTNLLSDLHLSGGNVFGTVALEAAYTHGTDWVDQMLKYVQRNVDFVTEYFETRMPQIKVTQPEGTYLMWLDFSELGMTNEELHSFMIEKAKVGFNDGIIFGKGGEGFQRMNVASPRKTIETALHRIEKAVNNN